MLQWFVILLISGWSVGFTWALLTPLVWGWRKSLGGWNLMGVSSTLLALVLVLSGCTRVDDTSAGSSTPVGSLAQGQGSGTAVDLHFPVDRYPYTAAHIQAAIKAGHSATCTIDRSGAEENRKYSLKGIPTKTGYDRDEWPMAMCAEGGKGAHVEYVPASDNRGAGSWVGGRLRDLPDGTKVTLLLDGSSKVTNEKAVPSGRSDSPGTSKPAAGNQGVPYRNCTEVKAAGAAPIRTGDPGWNPKLDRDGDGVGCER